MTMTCDRLKFWSGPAWRSKVIIRKPWRRKKKKKNSDKTISIDKMHDENNKGLTEYFQTMLGLQQGAVLSCYLFAFYLNDLPDLLK